MYNLEIYSSRKPHEHSKAYGNAGIFCDVKKVWLSTELIKGKGEEAWTDGSDANKSFCSYRWPTVSS